jgi:hypothetical protein
VPGDLFKKIKKENIKIWQQKKLNHLSIDFPDEFREGLQYAAVRINLKGEKQAKRIEVVFNNRVKTRSISNEQRGQFTLFHPVTSQDRNEIKMDFLLPLEAELHGIDYTFLSPQEFSSYSPEMKEYKNQIHSLLNTKRKNSTLDELYNLKQDIEMNKNLLRIDGINSHKDIINEYRKSLYLWFEFYHKKGVKLLGKAKKGKKLTPKEIKILKSLGYI